MIGCLPGFNEQTLFSPLKGRDEANTFKASLFLRPDLWFSLISRPLQVSPQVDLTGSKPREFEHLWQAPRSQGAAFVLFPRRHSIHHEWMAQVGGGGWGGRGGAGPEQKALPACLFSFISSDNPLKQMLPFPLNKKMTYNKPFIEVPLLSSSHSNLQFKAIM